MTHLVEANEASYKTFRCTSLFINPKPPKTMNWNQLKLGAWHHSLGPLPPSQGQASASRRHQSRLNPTASLPQRKHKHTLRHTENNMKKQLSAKQGSHKETISWRAGHYNKLRIFYSSCNIISICDFYNYISVSFAKNHPWLVCWLLPLDSEVLGDS